MSCTYCLGNKETTSVLLRCRIQASWNNHVDRLCDDCKKYLKGLFKIVK